MSNILDQLENSPTAMFKACEILAAKYKNLTFDISSMNASGNLIANIDGNKFVAIDEFYTIQVGEWGVFDVILRFINHGNLWNAANTIYAVLDMPLPYIRVGINWFKIVTQLDRYDIPRETLLPWNTLTLKQDHGKDCVFDLPKYDSFTMQPDNINYQRSVNGDYNQYAPFEHESSMGGEWKWTEHLLRHIFDEQYDLGIKYLQVLYKFPKQPLPILVLTSEDRETGKSTFLHYLDQIFGANMVVINPQDISSSFNDSYGLKNIIGIEESRFDSIQVTEKLKAIATQQKMLINPKGITPYSVPFFGKLIITSNDEHKFSKVDQAEIRYWIRKVPTLKGKIKNTDILSNLKEEIPNFLAHLLTLDDPDFSKSRMVFTADEINTSSLDEVKNESMTPLYKDMYAYFERLFNENASLHEIEFIPLDVKERFFLNNTKVDNSYIRTVLKKEFHLEPGKNRRYIKFDGTETDKGVGMAYSLSRKYFNINKIEDEQGLPF